MMQLEGEVRNRQMRRGPLGAARVFAFRRGFGQHEPGRLLMALRIDQRDIGTVKVLDLAGKLAGDAADALWDRIDDLLDAGHSKLILNLGGVSFIDSAALGGLLSKRAAVANAGGQLKLLNLSERVWDLIVTTKLEMVFDTFGSEADAVQSFR